MSKKQIFILFSILAVGLLILILGIGIIGVSAAVAYRAPAWIHQTESDSIYYAVTPDSARFLDSAITLGTPVTLNGTVRTALRYHPAADLSLSLTEGLEIVGKPKWETHYDFFSPAWIQTFSVTLQTCRPDSYPNLTATLKLKGIDNTPDTQIQLAPFPILYVVPLQLTENDIPVLAGHIDPPPAIDPWRQRSAVIAAFILLAAAISAGIWFLVHNRDKRLAALIIPPWERAVNYLDALRQSITQNDISSEQAVSRLTDIVRNYLTQRFGLPASSMTTPEFFTLLAGSHGTLEETHQQFLTKFLEAADLIKFAGVAAEQNMIIAAVEQARQLVRETEPKEGKGA